MDYKSNQLDKTIIYSCSILAIWGLFMVFITTNSKDSGSKPYMTNQLLATVLGIISIIVIMKLSSKFIEKMCIPIYISSVLLLIWVLFNGIGESQWGAKSWIRFKFIGFQPSELVKVGYILFLAKYISLKEYIINDIRSLFKVLFFAAIPIVLIILQPDFGTSMVYLFILFMLLSSAKIDKRYIAFGLSLISLISPFLWMKLSNYQKNRFYNFFNPNYDVEQSGFQVLQSKLAIKTSGLFGKGFLRTGKAPYINVPENHNDFIFSAVVESFGVIGSAFMIVLFIVLIYKVLLNSHKEKNTFQAYALKGFAAMFFIHFFENVAMTMGAMPMTGIPLPLISYGGTFQLTNFIVLGLVLKFSSDDA